MTFRYDDRVKVTTTSPGTGAIPAAAPAAAGAFIQLSAIANITNGDIIPYSMDDGALLFEDGFGTWNSVTGLTRTTVKRNSAGNTSNLNFNTGPVTVRCSAIAVTLPLIDNSGNVTVPGGFFGGGSVGGGWGGGFANELRGQSSFYKPTSGGQVISVRVDNTNTDLMDFFFNASGVGVITTNGSLTVYGTTSSGKTKDNKRPMEVALALGIVRAYQGWSYEHKLDGSPGHGFWVEHFVEEAAKLGVDAQTAGLVYIPDTEGIKRGMVPAMDYGKATPFLVTLAIDQEHRIAALEALIRAKG